MESNVLTALSLVTLALIVVLWWRNAHHPPLTDVGTPSTTHAAGERVDVVEVIPGRLGVRIFCHVLQSQGGPIPCWTYVSDGLLVAGHKEVALTVKREPGEGECDFPRAPLDLYREIHAYALKKQFVHEGGSTRFDPSRPGLLRDDFHAVLYTPAQQLEGVSTPGPYLTALLVTAPELEVATRFGHLRLMALLGERYRFYPTVPWADRKRPEITRPEAMTTRFLAKMPPSHLVGASALTYGRCF